MNWRVFLQGGIQFLVFGRDHSEAMREARRRAGGIPVIGLRAEP
jgi:hypothetical protein